MRKLTAILLTVILALTLALQPSSEEVQAASKYITVKYFSKLLATELKITSDKINTSDECVKALIDIGIIIEGDFKDYSVDLKRGDLLMLLNRADDYLNNTVVNADLIQEVIEKRISDISKVTEVKQEVIAKGFIKGFLKGYSNGEYSTNRNLKLTNKITRTGAISCIKMLKNKSLRAKISPDGQLIRTTELPNNAKMFPYILASYPNRYYEAKLRFEGITRYRNGVLVQLESPTDYTYPIDVSKASYNGITDFYDTMDKYLDTWMDKVNSRVWNTFNVNYKTINNEWVETMAQSDSYIYNSRDKLYRTLNEYVIDMKENKTIVECKKVSLDSSSMYYYNGFYYIRCYVNYRIVSSNTKTSYTGEELCGEYRDAYNSVLYTRAGTTDLSGYTLGKWKTAIFDVGICTGQDDNDGSMFGVCDCNWTPYMFRNIERK